MKARFRQAAVRIGLVLLACWLFSATSVEAAHVQLDMAGVQKLRSAPEPKWVVKWEDERGEREGKHACEAEDSPHESTRWFLRKRRSPAGLVPIEKLMDARARAERMPGGSLSTLPPPRVLLRPVRELTSGKAVPGAIRTFTEASMPPSQPGVASATVNGWSSIGPGNIGGRTRALAAASSSVVYAGGVAGGVWKTTDGGQNWVALDDSMANLAVSCLALDPKDASVVYAGTGEESGSGEGDTNAVRGAGIFKSIDGGAHWNQLASTASKADFYFVNKFAVSLLFGTRLYAATTTGLFASSDGGFSWNRLAASQLTGCITDLVVGQNGSSDVLFVWKRSDGFYVSTDSGATFVARKTGLTPSFQASIAISRTGDRFLALCGARSGTLDGIFTSVDNGATWATLSIPVGSGFDGSFDGQLEYDNICAIDPFNSRRLWVGGVNLFVSNDAGATWAQASRWCAPTVDVPHADQHAIAFSPDYDGTTHQRIFFGNDGGVFATDSGASALPSFRTLNHGYGVTQFYNGAVSATGTVVIGGTQDNGSDGYDSKNPSPNPSFDWNRIFPGDGGYCAIDPTNDNVFYVESQNGELRKTSQGIACQTPDCQFPLCYSSATTGITEGLPFITVFAMDPSNSSRLWLGGTQPWRTINGATSWSSATSGAALHGIDTITAIGIAPSSNGSTVYLGTDGGSVFKSTIALTQAPTWLNISAGLPANSYVSGIAVHPTDSNTLYVTFSGFDVPNGQVWKSMNGGISWLSLRGTGPTAFPNVPCHVVAIDPKDTNTLFAGTDSGVFSSTDAGASWSNVNSPGLANTIVEALVYQQSTDRLFAFTHGRGVFVADVSNVPAPNVGITKIATSLSTVGLGQTFTTTVTLRNFGSAAANFTGEHLSITGSAVTAAELATARSLAAGQTTTFTFTCTGASQGVASITSATITATSAQDGSAAGIRSNAASPVDVTVIRPTPALKIISIASARSIVGVGQSFTATVTVRNDGTGAANLSAGKLTVNPKLLLTPTDTVLSISLAAGGGTASLMLGVTGGPSTGAASITSATLTASSAFDGSSVPIAANLATAASVSVVNAIPSIKIDSISVTRTQLATGQTLGATVKLHNYGTGTANLTAAQLVFAGSNLSAPALALAKSIAPAADLPLDFVVTGNSAGSSSITSLTLAATNAFTGLPVGIAGNNAQSKNVLVQELAGLVVDSVTLSSARVHRGQIGALARVVLRNPAPAATGGTAIFIAGALRIGTSNGGYTVSRLVAAPDTLAAGRSASMSYAIDVLDTAALGLTNVTADVRAQEGNTSVPISVVNSRRATWSASDRASLGVGSLASSQSIVRRRQRGITVQVPVTNTAPAATGDLAIALSVALRFNGSASGYAVQPLSSAIANLPAGQSATLFFSVDALDTAPRGSTAIAAVVSALDAVSLQQVPVANPSSTAWTVQLTGSVTADSLVATAQVLEPGHAGNTVRLALHNPGDLSVDFNAGLRFNHQSAGYLVTTAAGNAVTLAGGASAILTFSVDVLPTAAPGLTTLTADLQANASGAAAAVVNAVQTRWQIQLPAALAVTAIRPGATRLLRGQRQVPVELAIANTAPATSGASAMAIAGTPLFGGSRAGYAVTTLATNVTTLAAGQSRVLTYLVDVLSQAPLGATTLTALVGARDVNTAAAAPVANGITASWTVVGPAELHITRVTPGRAAVTQGEIGLRVEVGIANSGATTAEDLLSDLIIGGNSLGYFILGDPNNAGLLAAGKSAVLTFTVSLSPSVALGPASLVAAVEGLESLQGGPLLVVNDAGAQWTVEAPADLVVLALTVPGAQVVRGERDLPIELLVENAGQTAMEGLSAGLRFNGSTANYAVTAEPANPVTLAAGESRVLPSSVDVLDSAPAGVVSVTSVVLATETHTGRAVPVTNRQAGSWRVLIPATLRLDALALSRTKVSAGQRGLAVRATVVNIGQDDTLSLAAGLRFNGSSEGFDTTTSPGNPTVLAAGQTARLDFTVDVRPDAAPGP
ncbi:MAG: hypothetical protein HY303_05190, partial [Candidatus Wallbacteria bacterium]|nr:hypothetical protein [Candidatus Wallbacteria bacterium]